MRVVFMGTPRFACPTLEHLVLNNNCEVVAVYTQPDRPAGRGRSLVSSPVKETAVRLGLPVVQPENLRSAAEASRLAGFKPDVAVVAAYGQILPQSVLDIPREGCINIHPSLLPRFRGASPVAGAILAGDEFTGVTVMLLDSGMDTGPLLARAAVPILSQDSTGSLTGKLSQMAAWLLQETLTGWMRHEIAPQPQKESEATYTARITREEGEIDWKMSAVEIWRRVRAYNPWPGCYTRWGGKQFKVIESVPLPAGAVAEAGQVVESPAGGVELGIGTGEGILGLLEVQLEGKRPMSAAEFLRGQRNFIGARLPG